MSDYHVLAVTPKLTKAQVVFHIPIPTENNLAGVSLQLAAYQYQGNATITSRVPDHASEFTTENAALQTGAIYEYSYIVRFLKAIDTPAQKQARIDSVYNLLAVSVLAKLRDVLQYWGKNRDVP